MNNRATASGISTSLANVLAALTCVVMLALLITKLPVYSRIAWVRALLDLTHIPLGAILTLSLSRFFRRAGPTLMTSAVLLAAAEWGQSAVADRMPDSWDLLLGVAGSLLIGVWYLDWPTAKPARTRIAVACYTILLMAPKIAPIIDGWYAYRTFPIVWSAATPCSHHRWVVQGATKSPADDADVFRPIEEGSRMELVQYPVRGDWTNFERFRLRFTLETSRRVLLSIRDGRKVEPPAKRFDYRAQLEAGTHDIAFDLTELAEGQQYAPLDVSRIRSIHLVFYDSDGEVAIHELILE